MLARRHAEDDLTVQVADFLARFCPVLWWHVPNGGVRRLREAARFKRMGVRAGCWDLHFLLPGGRLGVIELKVKPNRLTDEQETFGHAVRNAGGLTSVAYSLNDVYAALWTWGVKLPTFHNLMVDGQ
jgi:hypothetical protein